MNVKKWYRNKYAHLLLVAALIVGFLVIGITIMMPEVWGHWDIWEWRYYSP